MYLKDQVEAAAKFALAFDAEIRIGEVKEL